MWLAPRRKKRKKKKNNWLIFEVPTSGFKMTPNKKQFWEVLALSIRSKIPEISIGARSVNVRNFWEIGQPLKLYSNLRNFLTRNFCSVSA